MNQQHRDFFKELDALLQKHFDLINGGVALTATVRFESDEAFMLETEYGGCLNVYTLQETDF